jgi:HAD superfamily hydrolase (TIGR01509 family)
VCSRRTNSRRRALLHPRIYGVRIAEVQTVTIVRKPNIIFDLGNVLIHCDMGKATRMIAERSSLDHATIRERLFDAELIDAWDVGELDPDAFTERVKLACEWEGTSMELERVWQEMLVADPEMFAVYEGLLTEGYPIYILSNANPFHTAFVLREHPLLQQANGRVFSCECRMIKPQLEIYHHIAEKFSLEPAHSIFIDDKLPNIEAAEQAGFHAIHHSAVNTTKPRLYELIARLMS